MLVLFLSLIQKSVTLGDCKHVVSVEYTEGKMDEHRYTKHQHNEITLSINNSCTIDSQCQTLSIYGICVWFVEDKFSFSHFLVGDILENDIIETFRIKFILLKTTGCFSSYLTNEYAQELQVIKPVEWVLISRTYHHFIDFGLKNLSRYQNFVIWNSKDSRFVSSGVKRLGQVNLYINNFQIKD